ncbi:MAG: uncharacterized protein K0Q92_318 [Steroidobacteraceae bacterium]|jgi:uncharacterized repeat protein (TIGR01451 family)|nr:uncharacterized protein [Steroidobacteraceae bacterium]
MKSSLRQIKRVGLACVALGSIAVSQQAFAEGTAAGTTIQNTATVNYQVGGVSQAAINSNTAEFLVDNKVNLTVTRLNAAPGVSVSPGGTDYYTTFKLTNSGNKTQGYILNGSLAGNGDANLTGVANPFGAGPADTIQMLNTRTFVSGAACDDTTPTPTYDSSTDTTVFVDSLAADDCVYVFVVANADTIAAGFINGAVAAVRLTAQARIANSGAATVVPKHNDDADIPGTEQNIFADAGQDATESADSVFVVSSATLTVAKSSAVISDPINVAPNFKAIPGAVMEYTIRLTNNGGADATGVVITDLLPTNGISFTTAQYNSGASDVSIQIGAGAPTFCVAEVTAGPSADGCYVTPGGVLTVGAPALTQVATGGVATEVAVRFRMTIAD